MLKYLRFPLYFTSSLIFTITDLKSISARVKNDAFALISILFLVYGRFLPQKLEYFNMQTLYMIEISTCTEKKPIYDLINFKLKIFQTDAPKSRAFHSKSD